MNCTHNPGRDHDRCDRTIGYQRQIVSRSRVPAVLNATASFRLPSGSTPANRRREKSRFSPCQSRYSPPRKLRLPCEARMAIHKVAMETLQRHAGWKKCRQRARALEILHGANRSPSPLRRAINTEPTTKSTSSNSSVSGKPDIEAIRKALQMTKSRMSSNSTTYTSGVTTPRLTTAPQPDPLPTQRRLSEPGLRGTMKTVPVTKYTVP